MDTTPTLIMQDALAMPELLALIMDEPVHITEKLPGDAWEATISRNERDPDGPLLTVYLNGVRQTADHALYDQKIDYFLYDMLRVAPVVVETITVRGVRVSPSVPMGFQSGLVRLFDMEVNGQIAAPQHAFAMFQSWGMLAVPVLSLPGQTLYQWLNRRAPETAVLGWSRLGNTPRLGVVIRPLEERNHPDFGRFILKMECAS